MTRKYLIHKWKSNQFINISPSTVLHLSKRIGLNRRSTLSQQTVSYSQVNNTRIIKCNWAIKNIRKCIQRMGQTKNLFFFLTWNLPSWDQYRCWILGLRPPAMMSRLGRRAERRCRANNFLELSREPLSRPNPEIILLGLFLGRISHFFQYETSLWSKSYKAVLISCLPKIKLVRVFLRTKSPKTKK